MYIRAGRQTSSIPTARHRFFWRTSPRKWSGVRDREVGRRKRLLSQQVFIEEFDHPLFISRFEISVHIHVRHVLFSPQKARLLRGIVKALPGVDLDRVIAHALNDKYRPWTDLFNIVHRPDVVYTDPRLHFCKAAENR